MSRPFSTQTKDPTSFILIPNTDATHDLLRVAKNLNLNMTTLQVTNGGSVDEQYIKNIQKKLEESQIIKTLDASNVYISDSLDVSGLTTIENDFIVKGDLRVTKNLLLDGSAVTIVSVVKTTEDHLVIHDNIIQLSYVDNSNSSFNPTNLNNHIGSWEIQGGVDARGKENERPYEIGPLSRIGAINLDKENSGLFYFDISNCEKTIVIDTCGNKNLQLGNTSTASIVLNPYDKKVDISGATTIHNTLHVDKSLIVGENSKILGNMDVSGTVDISGATTIHNTLHVDKSLIVGENSKILGNMDVSGTVDISGATTIHNTLHVDKSLTVGENSKILGNMDVSGTVDISGATTILNTLHVDKSLTVGENSKILGNMDVSGTVDISGATTIHNTLHVDKSLIVGENSKILGNMDVSGTVDISGATTIHNTLHVDKSLTVGENSKILGNMDVSGTVDISGATTIHNTLHVDKSLIVGENSKILGNMDVSGTVDISGATTIHNTLHVDKSLTVGENSKILGNMDVSGTVDISGATTIHNTLHVDKSLTVGENSKILGNMDVSGTVDISGATTIHNTLHVDKSLTVGENSKILGNMDVSGTVDISGATTIHNTLHVDKSLTVGENSKILGNMDVSGTVDISGATTIHNTLHVDKSLTVDNSATILGNMDVSGIIKIGENGNIRYNNNKLQFNNGTQDWSDFGSGGSGGSSWDISGKYIINDDTVDGVHITKDLDVSGTARFEKNIKIGHSEIIYKDAVLQFHNGDGNYVQIGTSTASTTATTSTTSIFNTLVSGSSLAIFNTATKVSSDAFVYNANVELYLSKSPDILINLLTTLKPNDTLTTFIEKLPDQLLVPGPTDLSYNTSDYKLNWKYDGGTKYPVSGFYLHGGLNKPSTVKRLTNSEFIYTPGSGTTEGTYILHNKLDPVPVPGTVYYLHGITSVYGNSFKIFNNNYLNVLRIIFC